MDIQELRREAQTMQPQLTADRRRLHRNPEAGAVLPETVAYVKGFDAGWADFCPAKPCLPLSIYGILNRKNRETARMGRLPVF